MQVDGRDDAHVGLPPFAAAVGDLGFEQLERVEPQLGLGDFERAPEDGAGFVLDEEEGAVGFALGDLLEEAEEADGGEEEPGRVRCERRSRERACGGIAEFVDFGPRRRRG